MKYLLFAILTITSDKIFSQQVIPKGKIVLQTFPFSDVQLLAGKWKQQVEETKDYYLRIPNDDLLKGFRKKAHLPTFGAADMGGWYSHDYWNPFGQIISGLSRFYAATGDEACKEKVDALISGWSKCIDTSGYFFFTDTPNAQHYIYEKMVCGLVDACLYANNKDALHYLSIITDWAIKNLSRNLMWAGEWYTLPENLYRAYLITGNKKYFDFANEWEYTRFWNGVKDDSDIYKAQSWYHAYSHLNTFSSAAMAYEVKGDSRYKQTIIKAYDFFNQQQCYATGGFGPNEGLFPEKDMVNAVYHTHSSFETQCGSWAIFKLCKYLITITGDARYGDWIEKAMINGVGASIPMSADGRVMYYSDYNPREGFKKNTDDSWTCCTGTRPQAISDYQELIYFKSDDGIYVNLYESSGVEWNQVKLIQATQFPESDHTTFEINFTDGSKMKNFTLHFRKPLWLQKPASFMLNGDPLNVDTLNNWYFFKRTWKQGDKLTVTLPMNFEFKSLVTAKPFPVAINYGPVTMAIRTADANSYPTKLLQNPEPWKYFIKVDGEANTWHTSADTGLLIRPFYAFKEKEPYVIYLDSAVKNYIPNRNIATTGNWRAWYQFTDEVGATITAKFAGTGFKLTGSSFDDAGMFTITIDDTLTNTFDEYNAVRGVPFEAKVTGLSNGQHVAVLKTLEEKNKSSRGRFVNYATIEKID
ncbi:MAG: beta-L-arabinofuranosidase domain-containing protein [Parafilimonas sp.]